MMLAFHDGFEHGLWWGVGTVVLLCVIVVVGVVLEDRAMRGDK